MISTASPRIMISKNQLKQLRSLAQKKQRKLHNLFLVQGEKNVLELLNSSLSVQLVFAVAEFIQKHSALLKNSDVVTATAEELAKASTLVSNNSVIAIVEIPQQKHFKTLLNTSPF